MQLVSLNIWCGKLFESLIKFTRQHASDTDIFCFQEMMDTKSDTKSYRNIRANILSEMKNVLTEFKTYYFPTMAGYDDEGNLVPFDLTYGQAIFIRKNIPVNSQGSFFITKEKNFRVLKKDFSNLPTPLQYICFTLSGKKYAVFNYHGSPIPGDKLDNKQRLLEAQKTIKIIKKFTGAKILMGDFNLLPGTRSIKIFESDLRNLIKEFNIKTTRSKLSPFYGEPDFQKFADYTFVSKDINVQRFEVPEVEVSDHLPMILEFS